MAFVNIGTVVYPVGSYYLSNTATSPATLLGGTWTQISDNRFLCGASSISSGGSNSVNHTHQYGIDSLSYYGSIVNFNQSSRETYIGLYGPYNGTNQFWSGNVEQLNAMNGVVNNVITAASKTVNNCTHYGAIADTTSTTINNRPLYRTCYMWYRTA